MTELGPLPEEWKVVSLGYIFVPVEKKDRSVRIQTGQVYRTLTVKLYAGGITLRQEIEGDRIGSTILYRTEINDFVFSKIDARNGAWGFVPGELGGGLVSGDFPILRLIDTVADRDFIALSLSRPDTWEPLRNIAVGTTNRRRIQVQQLLCITIPFPPLREQRAIAHVLRTVQRAKEATERVIQATRELKKSLMRHLFTYGPVPVDEADKVLLKETEICLMPEHWKVERLGKVAVFVRDSINPANYPDEVFDYYSIPAYHLVGGSVAEAGKEIRSQKLIVEAKDVLFGKLNPRVPKVLLVAASRRRKISSTEFIPLRGVPGLIAAEYLYYLCWSDYVMPKAQELISGSTPSRQRVDARAFSLLLIPLPPLPEQREIARILEVVDKKLGAEEARKQALDSLFKILLHHLMTGQVRVKYPYNA